MADKRYYWIKLKTDFFSKKEIDFLLSQKNGCEYIVLYQMLCLNTANNNGEMATKINEMIIPYDVDKIVRDTKYFDTDTVVVALELFKKLGLIYKQEDQILKISSFEDMVGSECSSAKRVREYREKKVLQCNNDVTQEYRDKSIEYRDNIIEKDSKKKKVFIPPTLEEISLYCKERNNNINPKKFYEYFSVNNWIDSKGNKVKSWKQKIITWEGYNKKENKIKEPEWFNKNNKIKETTKEEENEMKDLLKQIGD